MPQAMRSERVPVPSAMSHPRLTARRGRRPPDKQALSRHNQPSSFSLCDVPAITNVVSSSSEFSLCSFPRRRLRSGPGHRLLPQPGPSGPPRPRLRAKGRLRHARSPQPPQRSPAPDLRPPAAQGPRHPPPFCEALRDRSAYRPAAGLSPGAERWPEGEHTDVPHRTAAL